MSQKNMAVFYLLLGVLVQTILLLSFYNLFKLPKSPDASFFKNILLGHRGSGTDNPVIPENSLESFVYAHERGADGIFVTRNNMFLKEWSLMCKLPKTEI